MPNYIPMQTVYRLKNSDIKSTSYPLLCTACGDGLTINTSFVAQRFNQSQSPHTIFHEIEVVPRQETLPLHIRDFFSEGLRIYKESPGHYLDMVATSLLQSVYNLWDTSSSHIILHSSGVDSRLVSHAIRQLSREFGPDWLGDTVFVCSKWETSEFIKIMEYEGWDKSQYLPVGTGVGSQSYYVPEVLDFANLWKRTGGISAIPVNLFYWLPEIAQQTLSLPGPIQLFTSQWGNTLDNYAGPQRNGGAGYKHKQFYNSVLTQRPMYGDSLALPFTDINLIRVIAGSSVRMGTKLRFRLLEYCDPKLAAFTNLDADGDRHRKIADWAWKDIMSLYHNSWYGKHVKPDATPKHRTTEFQPFWSHYCAASLCEWLHNEGVELRVK